MQVYQDDNLVGHMFYGARKAPGAEVTFRYSIYVDNDVTLTGTCMKPTKSAVDVYSFSLKRGWNLVVDSVISESESLVVYQPSVGTLEEGAWFFLPKRD
jgi:hypothetical protein